MILFADIEDPDQIVHTWSLIRAFAVHPLTEGTFLLYTAHIVLTGLFLSIWLDASLQQKLTNCISAVKKFSGWHYDLVSNVTASYLYSAYMT